MPAKDLGTKHTCWKCSTKFYDLKKADPVCPKCGADPRKAPSSRSIAAAEKKARAKPAPVEETPEIEEADVEEELDEAEDEAADDDEP